MKHTVANGKYDYTTVETTNLEIVGWHDTIAVITKDEALEMAQSLISSAMNPNADNTVTVHFSLRDPYAKGKTPETVIAFGHDRHWKPKLHWATVEGHQIYCLNDEWLEKHEQEGI